ncbi:MAG: peptidoglycan DD-metalloendopeptidase family protein [Bacteroidota bacterium]|nr:peptidoglycan DD-metalloendopeptidase family protein [Bacteroidota bacterium]
MKNSATKFTFKRILPVFLGALVILMVVILVLWRQTLAEPEPIARANEYFLGIRTDTLDREEGTLNPNWTLSDLLNEYGVSSDTIQKSVEAARKVFDPRQMKAGQSYYALLSDDSTGTLKYLIYERSLTDYVVFDFTDSVSVYLKEKPVKTYRRRAEGVIKESLWNSLIKNGQNPELSYKLAELYAWQIDFFSIKEGDKYCIIYDEMVVDDSVSVDVGTIYGALIKHNGKKYYAIPFIQDGMLNYFDENGRNLKKAFLKAPLKYSRISSRFSNSRLHPILRIRRPHHGVDYSAPYGTPVFSIGDGTVIDKGYIRGGGNAVKIKHNRTYTTTYMHLSRYAKGIHRGSSVKQGQRIGYVGATGLATGPHLDFRVYKNGKPVNPLKMISPPVNKLKDKNKERFMMARDQLMAELKKQHIHHRQ